MTMTLISTVNVGSGGATAIEFGNIPQNYTDLCVIYSLRSGTAAVNQNVYLFFNNIGSGYSGKQIYGQGGGYSSNSLSNSEVLQANGSSSTASTFSSGSVYINEYTSSGNKTYSVDQAVENNATTNIATLVSGLWANSAAITNINLALGSNSFTQHSTASLYGISKGSGGATVS